jgi:hypothetical protein
LLFQVACSRQIAGSSLKIALVVGTILNIVNQLGRVMDGLDPSWMHVVLNYLVPFCVASYSAARSQLRR